MLGRSLLDGVVSRMPGFNARLLTLLCLEGIESERRTDTENGGRGSKTMKGEKGELGSSFLPPFLRLPSSICIAFDKAQHREFCLSQNNPHGRPPCVYVAYAEFFRGCFFVFRFCAASRRRVE